MRRAWHVLEPDKEYRHGWHIDAICEHLEAVSRGEINRLQINVPPGMMKSLTVSVLWQAWEWGPFGKPTTRWLSTAFNDGPVTRDARKTRDLILSDWYRARWPEVSLVRYAERSFANSATGTREGVSFGSLTSQRGDRLLIDDPHSTDTAESDAEREATTRRFREGAQNRLNDIKKSAIVVIMQRLHEADVCGVIADLGLPYEKLILPMEFEPDRRCKTSIGFEDPRTEEGELLFPALFPAEELKILHGAIGEYAWAGQYQQRPAPRTNGFFEVDNIEVIDTLPRVSAWARAWDLAGTAGAGAFTAGGLLGRLADGSGYVIADMRRGQLKTGDVQTLIKETAAHDRNTYRPEPRIRIPQDPGQAGVAQRNDYAKLLDGYAVKFLPPTGDKVLRALPFATQVETRRVFMLRGEWNDPLKAEMRGFPAFKFKDQVDALSDAYAELLANPDPIDLEAFDHGARADPYKPGH